MTYQVLARKWRPGSFDSVIGQDATCRALVYALNQKKLHHAILFSGTRGVGKTSLARLFAKSLSCHRGISADPCGTCEACIAIEQGHFLDLIEVDAASRASVEETRDLLEQIRYPPCQGPYKMILIDEIHMLSKHSFNALLKAVEEPPEQTLFLFATTEPQKLPATLLSRCLHFRLKPIAKALIKRQLQTIIQSEHHQADDAALEILAKAAQGSLRDALTLLDQAIAYTSGHLEESALLTLLGHIPQTVITQLVQALFAGHAPELFKIIHELESQGLDFYTVFDELLHCFQTMAMIRQDPLALWPTQPAVWVELARSADPELLQLWYQIVLMGKKDFYLAASPRSGIDMLFLRLLAFRPQCPPQKLPIPQETLHTPPPSSPALSEPKSAHRAAINWPEQFSSLKLEGLTQTLLQHCRYKTHLITENSPVKLVVELPKQQKILLSKERQQGIAQALIKQAGCPVELTIALVEGERPEPIETDQVTQSPNPNLEKLIARLGATLKKTK